jgi:hypothetical protein
MAVGLIAATANGWLNTLGGTGGASFTAISTPFIKLHIGDPGAAAATAPSVGSTTRVAVTYSTASGGVKTMNGTLPVWTNGGTSETLSHISLWDTVGPTGGNPTLTGALTTPQAWASGNTFTLSSLSISLSPLAA